MKVEATREQVDSILNDYKSNTKMDQRTGDLVFGQLPIIFARAELMSGIYQELESLVGESASGVLKRMGRTYGEKFYELVSEQQEDLLEDRETLYQFICAETQAIGWGRMRIEDEDGTIVITCKDGFAGSRNLADKGKKNRPVDSYFLGYFEGFFNKLSGSLYSSEEVECVAKGDQRCRMVLTRKM